MPSPPPREIGLRQRKHKREKSREDKKGAASRERLVTNRELGTGQEKEVKEMQHQVTEKDQKTPAKGDMGQSIPHAPPPPMETRSCGYGPSCGRARDPGTQAGGTHCGHPGWMDRGARRGESEGSPGGWAETSWRAQTQTRLRLWGPSLPLPAQAGGGNSQGHPQGESQTWVLQALWEGGLYSGEPLGSCETSVRKPRSLAPPLFPKGNRTEMDTEQVATTWLRPQ